MDEMKSLREQIKSVQAACRTYNILVAEERKVAAALLFE